MKFTILLLPLINRGAAPINSIAGPFHKKFTSQPLLVLNLSSELNLCKRWGRSPHCLVNLTLTVIISGPWAPLILVIKF